MYSERRRGRASEETRPVAGGQAGKAITARKTLPAKARRVKAGRLARVERFWKDAHIFGILTKTGSICSACLSSKEKARVGIKSLIFPNDLLRISSPALVCRRCGEPVFMSGAAGYIKKLIVDGVKKAMEKASA